MQFGLSPNALTMEAQGSSTTYTASDMCEAPANTTTQGTFRDPGFMHHVLLTGKLDSHSCCCVFLLLVAD